MATAGYWLVNAIKLNILKIENKYLQKLWLYILFFYQKVTKRATNIDIV